MPQTYDINLISLIDRFHSEEKCRAYLEALRWPDGATCPRCSGSTVSKIAQRDQYDCDSCRYQFSVTSGTIFHDTHLPLWKWFAAVYLIVESKKGMSANQLKRTLGVSYKTAWYLAHRIREALRTEGALLSGIIEVDETWIGGKVRGKGQAYKGNKTMVIGAVQRGGDVRMQSGERPNKIELHGFIRKYVSPDATAIYTDNHSAYDGIADENTKHEVVNHSVEEWVRADVHTNTVESAWSLFKRGVAGSFHKVSKKHLDRYLDEFEFRFNNRYNPYIFRDAMRELIRGERIEYKTLTA